MSLELAFVASVLSACLGLRTDIAAVWPGVLRPGCLARTFIGADISNSLYMYDVILLLTHPHTHTPSLSPTHLHPHTLTLTLTHTLSPSLSLSPSPSHPQLYTPLHTAAAGGQTHAVKLLLELGANVSRHSRWKTSCFILFSRRSCSQCKLVHVQ